MQFNNISKLLFKTPRKENPMSMNGIETGTNVFIFIKFKLHLCFRSSMIYHDVVAGHQFNLMSITDEGYFRNVSCTLNLISRFLFLQILQFPLKMVCNMLSSYLLLKTLNKQLQNIETTLVM